MSTIEISDHNDKHYLSFDLMDVLKVIEPFSDGLEWYLAEFQLGSFHPRASDTPNVEPWVLALWRAVERGTAAERLTWDTLVQFARNVRQTDSCLILAIKPGISSPKEPLDLNGEDFEVVVQAVDSTFWAITCRNKALIDRFAANFHNVKLVGKTHRYH
jgi:hypothetical protein